MPEFYRRYLMGHSPGTAAIVAYTHLNQLRQQFLGAIQGEFLPVARAIENRGRQLGLFRT
jgi:hypothetical protein